MSLCLSSGTLISRGTTVSNAAFPPSCPSVRKGFVSSLSGFSATEGELMTFILSCAVWGESRVTATRLVAGEPPTPSRRGPYTLIFPKVRGKICPFSYCSSGMFPHAPVLMVGGGGAGSLFATPPATGFSGCQEQTWAGAFTPATDDAAAQGSSQCGCLTAPPTLLTVQDPLDAAPRAAGEGGPCPERALSGSGASLLIWPLHPRLRPATTGDTRLSRPSPGDWWTGPYSSGRA